MQQCSGDQPSHCDVAVDQQIGGSILVAGDWMHGFSRFIFSWHLFINVSLEPKSIMQRSREMLILWSRRSSVAHVAFGAPVWDASHLIIYCCCHTAGVTWCQLWRDQQAGLQCCVCRACVTHCGDVETMRPTHLVLMWRPYATHTWWWCVDHTPHTPSGHVNLVMMCRPYASHT